MITERFAPDLGGLASSATRLVTTLCQLGMEVDLVFKRLYDRQEKRVGQGYYVKDIEQAFGKAVPEAIATTRILLDQVKTPKNQSASTYINGAVQAVHQIMSYKL